MSKPHHSLTQNSIFAPARNCALAASALLLAAGAATSAQAEQADSTATIACFGSDLSLTSARGTGEPVKFSAEVLNFSQPANVPTGKVVFLVDGQPVGAASGVALKRGQDPRTGQPAAIASASFSDLHLSPGAHTVKARYVPSTANFSPSQSAAANNLQIGNSASSSLADTSAFPKSGHTTPDYSSGKDAKNPVTPEPEIDKTRFWANVGQNFMWISPSSSQPLVVTGAPYVTAPYINTFKIPSSPGFIGLETDTSTLVPVSLSNHGGTLFGDSLDTGVHSGQEAEFGYWLDPEKTKAVEASFFYEESASTDFISSGDTNVAIPYLNLSTGVTTAFTVAQPFTTVANRTWVNTTPDVFVRLYNEYISTAASGGVTASESNRMWGTNLKYRQVLPQVGNLKEASFTFGFNYLDFFENLGIGSITTQSKSDSVVYEPSLGLPSGSDYVNGSWSAISESDTIKAENQFFAATVGVHGKYQMGRWWVSGDGDVAAGVMHETVDINGYTASVTTNVVTPTHYRALAGIPLQVGNGNGSTVVLTNASNYGYGLFAQPQNSGRNSHDVFAVMPTASVKLGYDITKSVSIFAGYRIFYISDVLRASDQVNHLGVTHSSLFGQSLDVGVEVGF